MVLRDVIFVVQNGWIIYPSIDIDAMEIQNTLKAVRNQSSVIGAHILDAKTLYGVIKEESNVRKWLGMPFYNQAAKMCLECSYVICVFSEGLLELHMDGSIVMYDNLGIEIGKMIDPSMKDTFYNSAYNVWLTEDFVLFSDRITAGPVAVVMKPINVDFLKDNPDVEFASLFYPNRHTDLMLRERFDIGLDVRCSSALIGINRRTSETEHITARTSITEYY